MKRYFIVILLLLTIFSTAITLAELQPEKIQLTQGENEVLMPHEFSPIYVSDFVKAYPDVLMITFKQNETNKTEGLYQEIYETSNYEEEVGYVNVFGGVGEDFIIYPDRNYKITLKKDMEVSIK